MKDIEIRTSSSMSMAERDLEIGWGDRESRKASPRDPLTATLTTHQRYNTLGSTVFTSPPVRIYAFIYDALV